MKKRNKDQNFRDFRKKILSSERSLLTVKSEALLSVALVFPNSYSVGMANLGFQAVYRLFNEFEGVSCERAFFYDQFPTVTKTIESGKELREFDVVAFSVSFELDLPKNQLATIEVSMMKSCSGGPSCFDNMLVGLLESAGGNKKKAEEIILSSKNRFFDIIQESFGLKKSDYELSCVECDMGRGGYIKAKGIYKDGSPLELYYHWGWCSSGGDDCGWDVCFSSTSDAIFKSVKTNFCSKLSSKQNNDGYICTDVEYDNTRRVKNKCFAGEYEKITGNKKTLAIKQISNRCKSSVDKGNFDCMKN